MIIVLIGPPGSGKGTQAAKLSAKYSLVNISTGDLFRALSSANTDTAKEVKSVMQSGALVNDELVARVLFEHISTNNFDNYILDGFPRTLLQAEYFNKFLLANNTKIDVVLNFDVEPDLLVERICSRISCAKCGEIYSAFNKPDHCAKCGSNEFVVRKDDNKETASVRMGHFNESTLPILDFYEKAGLLRDVDAAKSVDKVEEEIDLILRSLNLC